MTLQYKVKEEGKISFKVYDVMGKMIMETEPIFRKTGIYKEVLRLDVTSPGLYFLILENNNIEVDLRKLSLF